MPTITIDGQTLEVNKGDNILEACLNAGLDLPYFCWHPAMGSIGSCRQCALVQYQNENDTHGRIVMGCMTSVTEGARFSLDAKNAVEFREAVVESLMLNHPHDCPVCAEGGECHLQDMTVMVGHRDRRYRGSKNTHRNQYLGPLIHHEMNRCITCYRCERFYRDYAGGTDLGAQASRDRLYFGRQQDGVLESEFSGNLVEVCPTGVFTDKPFLADFSRKWDLQSSPSICGGCGVGCNIAPGERYGRLKRIHNRYNHDINGYFICDRGRFGGGYVNSKRRINFAGLQGTDGSFAAINQEAALSKAQTWMQNARIAGIGSPRASLESNFLLQTWVGSDQFSAGFSDAEGSILNRQIEILQSTRAMNPSIKQMESADAILVLGEDLTNTAPRVALGLRQAVRNKSLAMAEQMGLPDWQDAAVRNLAQDALSPLIIVTSYSSRLDDIALHTLTLTPNEIAEFGCNIAARLQGKPAHNALIDEIAECLSGAKRPLIISGSSMLQGNIIESAAAVAEALCEHNANTMLSLCAPEANSVGAAMLSQATNLSLSNIVEGADDIDVLVVLENDLARRLDPASVKKLVESGTKIIALDVLENTTLDHSTLVLPAASFAESQGTLVNNEGRAQRFFSVFPPAHDRLPSWQWLLQLATCSGSSQLSALTHFDEVVDACAASRPIFANLSEVAPDRSFRDRGQKIPRQTHRYSGRTAVNAAVSVHEPQQPIDRETPLAFSMEGLNRDQPAALTPYVWSPGWNSNQSLHKFQAEVDGPLKGGSAGLRLLVSSTKGVQKLSLTTPVSEKSDLWQLVPVHCLHGSEELSRHTDEIAELAGDAFLTLSIATAKELDVDEGDRISVAGCGDTISLTVKIVERMAAGCAGYSIGFASTRELTTGAEVHLQRDIAWQPLKPSLIASDRDSMHIGGVNRHV
ncbi:MAG: NADH-quinone oxidoreductase subunit NuoG [Porticoccaceae bacterium]|nr:NADH-quinone oxidoreductase subunit NuoG [Porticoccaceae bacterium]